MKLSLAMPKAVDEDMGGMEHLFAFLAVLAVMWFRLHSSLRMSLASSNEMTSVSPVMSSQPGPSK